MSVGSGSSHPDPQRYGFALRHLCTVPAATWLACAGLAANVFSGHSDKIGLPIGVDRLLLPAAIVLTALDPRRPRLGGRAVPALMVLFSAWATWSALGHGVVQDATAAFALLDRVYLPFAMFCCAPFLFGSRLARLLLLVTLATVGVYLMLTTVGQAVRLSVLVWPPYARFAPGRPGGPFLAAEANGMALLMCGMATGLLAWFGRGTLRTVTAVAAAGVFSSAVLTMTRSVWLGGLVALCVVPLVSRRLRRWLPVGMLLVVGAGLITASLFADATDSVARRATEASSLHDRDSTNTAALRIIAEHPLTGVGWRQFVDVGWDWLRQGDTGPMAHTHIEIHNVFLSRAAELGLPAAALYVAFLVGAVWTLARPISAGELHGWRLLAVGILCPWLITSLTSPNPYPFPSLVLWCVLGLLYGTRLSTSGASSQQPASPLQVRPSQAGHDIDAQRG